jgi:hypothetical protein
MSKHDQEVQPMCALFRGRMPANENGEPAATNLRRFEATAELQRTLMWQMAGGLPAARVWALR